MPLQHLDCSRGLGNHRRGVPRKEGIHLENQCQLKDQFTNKKLCMPFFTSSPGKVCCAVCIHKGMQDSSSFGKAACQQSDPVCSDASLGQDA